MNSLSTARSSLTGNSSSNPAKLAQLYKQSPLPENFSHSSIIQLYLNFLIGLSHNGRLAQGLIFTTTKAVSVFRCMKHSPAARAASVMACFTCARFKACLQVSTTANMTLTMPLLR